MITPQEIETIEFSKGVRGYKEEEVDDFLDELAADYASLIQENESLRADLDKATEKLDGYKNTEGAVIQTLEAAKSLMNDISASAEKRADILLKNAQLDAELKQRQAVESVDRLREEEAKLTQRVASFRDKFKNLLQAELDRFDDISTEIFGVSSLDAKAPEPAVKSEEKEKLSDEDLFKTLTNIRG